MVERRNSDDQGSGLVRTRSSRREPQREPQREAEQTESTQQKTATTAKTSRLSAAEVVKSGLEQVAGLTGKEVLGVTSVRAAEDGWLVDVEAVEDRRIPSSSDLLAIYEAQLGPDGALLGYRRKKRYSRGSGDRGEGS